jgi:hypothetical protein
MNTDLYPVHGAGLGLRRAPPQPNSLRWEALLMPEALSDRQRVLELQHPRPSQLIEAGRSLLEDLRERQILLGTRRQ